MFEKQAVKYLGPGASYIAELRVDRILLYRRRCIFGDLPHQIRCRIVGQGILECRV